VRTQGGVIASGKLEKGGRDSNSETFHATLRVNESRPAELSQQPEASLAWWRATSTAKRRQRVPMPCDRAPKSLLAGATVVDTSGGRAEAPQWLGASRSYRGPRTGRRDTRVAREPERPCRFHRDCRLETRLTNSRLIPSLVLGWWGRTRDETMVSPSEGNEVRREGRQGVGASHSTVEPGELTRGTLGREGDNASCTVGGQHGRSIEAEDRVNVTTTARQGSDGMR
jgi:hypothetical protein